jgi:hypothetical protein
LDIVYNMKNLQYGNRNQGESRHPKPGISESPEWKAYLSRRACLTEQGFDDMTRSAAAMEMFSQLTRKSNPVLSKGKFGSYNYSEFAPKKEDGSLFEVVIEENVIRVLSKAEHDESGKPRELGRILWVRGQGDEPFSCLSGDQRESVDSVLESAFASAKKAMPEPPYSILPFPDGRGGTFRVAEDFPIQLNNIAEEFNRLGTGINASDLQNRFNALKALPQVRKFMARFEEKPHFELVGKIETRTVVKSGKTAGTLKLAQASVYEELKLTEASICLVTSTGQPLAMAGWADGMSLMFFQNLLETPSRQIDGLLAPIEKRFQHLSDNDEAARMKNAPITAMLAFPKAGPAAPAPGAEKAHEQPVESATGTLHDRYYVDISADHRIAQFRIEDSRDLLECVKDEFDRVFPEFVSIDLEGRIRDLRNNSEFQEFVKTMKARSPESDFYLELGGSVHERKLSTANLFVMSQSGEYVAAIGWKRGTPGMTFEKF